MWVESESTNDQNVEADAQNGLLGRFLHLLWAHRAVLGTDRDGHANGFAVGAGGCARRIQPGAGKRVQGVELEALVLDRVLNAGLPKVVEDHRREVNA